jgi:hypothetical protein
MDVSTQPAKAAEVFAQNDGAVTKAYYVDLAQRGAMGEIAVALFRCQKRSTAAKRYRGGRFRRAAYDVKNWSLGELCRLLQEHALARGLRWGWKHDPTQSFHNWVLYVDLPQGQVSFHTAGRLAGPDYPGDWDGKHASAERIMAFCDTVFCGG